MEIKINVDETRFKDVLEKELEAFSKEELHEIVRECIVESLRNSEDLKSLFIVMRNNGYYNVQEPSEVMIEAAKSIDLSPAYKEIQDKMISTLKNNHHELLVSVLSKCIVNGLMNDGDFIERLRGETQCMLNHSLQELR